MGICYLWLFFKTPANQEIWLAGVFSFDRKQKYIEKKAFLG